MAWLRLVREAFVGRAGEEKTRDGCLLLSEVCVLGGAVCAWLMVVVMVVVMVRLTAAVGSGGGGMLITWRGCAGRSVGPLALFGARRMLCCAVGVPVGVCTVRSNSFFRIPLNES